MDSSFLRQNIQEIKRRYAEDGKESTQKAENAFCVPGWINYESFDFEVLSIIR